MAASLDVNVAPLQPPGHIEWPLVQSTVCVEGVDSCVTPDSS